MLRPRLCTQFTKLTCVCSSYMQVAPSDWIRVAAVSSVRFASLRRLKEDAESRATTPTAVTVCDLQIQWQRLPQFVVEHPLFGEVCDIAKRIMQISHASCYFLPLRSNILFSILFPNTLSLFASFSVRGPQYRSIAKITVLV
jgi:hypothetical protein